MRRNYLHAYAIVRYETERDPSVPINDRITVKKIVFDPDYAESETRRLNELNRDKGACYFWQITRIEQPFAASEPVVPRASSDEPEPSEIRP